MVKGGTMKRRTMKRRTRKRRLKTRRNRKTTVRGGGWPFGFGKSSGATITGSAPGHAWVYDVRRHPKWNVYKPTAQSMMDSQQNPYIYRDGIVAEAALLRKTKPYSNYPERFVDLPFDNLREQPFVRDPPPRKERDWTVFPQRNEEQEHGNQYSML